MISMVTLLWMEFRDDIVSDGSLGGVCMPLDLGFW
jgi:hypothetical protein